MQFKSFIEHFEDLRYVFLRSIFVYIGLFCLSYFAFPYWEVYLKGLVADLIYIRIYDAILMRLSAMGWISVILIIPYLIFEICIYLKDVFKINFLTLCGAILTYCVTVYFAFVSILPNFYSFLLAMSSENISFYLSAINCSQFAGSVLLVCSLIAAMPLLLLSFGVHKIFQGHVLREKRIVVLPIVFIISALITPPDVVSQIIVATIFYLIYELFILMNRFCRST